MNHDTPPSKPAKSHADIASEAVDGFGGSDEFDRITELAARVIDVPSCLVKVISGRDLLILGGCGLPPDLDKSRLMPPVPSIFAQAAEQRDPLVITNVADDERIDGDQPITGLKIGSYLGWPLVGHEGEEYGTFCVIDTRPRQWTDLEIEAVREFTALIARQLDLGSLRARQQSSLDVVIHDLKSPLSGIQMIAGLLNDQTEQIPPPLRPLIASLTESIDKAMSLVVSLGKRDKAGSETGCADPEAIVREQLALQESAAKEKSVAVEFSPADVSLPLHVAHWVVEQVVENLLSNAIKFTPAGGGVRLSSRREGGSWVFEVSDEGPGFTPEDRAQLYRRYARLSARPTAGEPSSGLGLSIVKRLIDQEGGAIELISQPGQGATFSVSFPLAER